VYKRQPPGMVHGDMEVLEETILMIMFSGPLDYNDPGEEMLRKQHKK